MGGGWGGGLGTRNRTRHSVIRANREIAATVFFYYFKEGGEGGGEFACLGFVGLKIDLTIAAATER